MLDMFTIMEVFIKYGLKFQDIYRDVDKFENRRKFCKNRRKGRRRHEQPQDARGGG